MLRELKGVGEKTEKLFQKIGITTTDDMLHYYPRNYDSYEAPEEIGSLKENSVVSVRGTVTAGVYVNRIRNLQVISITVADTTGKLPVVWFNAPYLKNTLKKGSCFIFRGKISRKKGHLEMEHPEIFTPAAYEEILHSMQPIYGLTAGLTNKLIIKLMHQILDEQSLQTEFLPDEIKEFYHLADDNYAISTVHFPGNMQELLVARKRLVFDEFLLFILAVQILKGKTEEAPNAFPMKPVWITEQVMEGLPYHLTKAQLRVWHEIEEDMKSPVVMNRLVQGDVGSGKTMIAALAMVAAAKAGFQSCMMAPTEVLARQHYENLQALYAPFGIETVLLTGSMTAAAKRKTYSRIENHEADVIIGTQALFQEKAVYDKLALIVTDEQHRFGVRQREQLAMKSNGGEPHVLVMSATPIPRTLAIILYSDLDISVVDEKPANRLPIKNCVVGTSYRPTAYRFLEQQIRQGHQVYVVCPMVEESENIEAENVQEYTEKLKKVLPADIKVEYLHGQMKPEQKNGIMERFSEGEIQVLVSTTVIEVGVDVPNATVMMIENAERFGLAQLHQLRGRVGRGDAQSYCIFIYGQENKKVKDRLNIMLGTNDGFKIASEDLKLRGPGDMFGIRQSGSMIFKIGDVFADSACLVEAGKAADHILSEDPELKSEKYAFLGNRITAKLSENREQVIL